MAEDLDSLIKSIDQRLTQSTNPSSRGICGGCKKDIHGTMITAMNNTWHPECWKCSTCGVLFGENEFYEHNHRPYCTNCNLEYNYPKCDYWYVVFLNPSDRN